MVVTFSTRLDHLMGIQKPPSLHGQLSSFAGYMQLLAYVWGCTAPSQGNSTCLQGYQFGESAWESIDRRLSVAAPMAHGCYPSTVPHLASHRLVLSARLGPRNALLLRYDTLKWTPYFLDYPLSVQMALLFRHTSNNQLVYQP